jgi:hypothetical protein
MSETTETRYGVRNAAGEWLTASFSNGALNFWFTPSPWMAYLTNSVLQAAELKAQHKGTAVEVWTKP